MAGKIRGLVNREGRYYARLVVPVELRAVVGKTEMREPLGPDRKEALRKLPAALARFNAAIEAVRQEQAKTALPPGDALPLSDQAILRGVYNEELRLDQLERDYKPTPSPLIGPQQGHDEYAKFRITSADRFKLFDKPRAETLKRVASGDANDDQVQALVGWRLDDLVTTGARSFKPGSDEWRSLARQIAGVELEVLVRKRERNEGDYNGKARHNALIGPEQVEEAPTPPVSLMSLLESYGKEMARSDRGFAAVRRWRSPLASLIDFVGFDDASRLTRKHVMDWKIALGETLAAKTVCDVHLVALKAVLGWAVENDRLKENVAAGVRQRVPKKPRVRSPSFNDKEAQAIIHATITYRKHERESERMASAKRWVSILMAHTGARPVELCQLRKEDFDFEGEIPSITITPAAGSVKTGEPRTFPIHQQLIDLGLREFVEMSASGALFFDAQGSRGGKGNPAATVSGRVTSWLQERGVIPEGLQPLYGWRHRFKTVTRELALDPRIVDAIQGHSPRTAGEAYGSVTLKAMKNAIDLLPAIALESR